MKVIITGATGMVGEGVLHHCLQDTSITEIVLLSRKSYGISHPKVKEILHSDFQNITPIKSQLQGYDACFFCMGVSSVGMDADTYYQLTYTLTLHIASCLAEINPQMTFCYISGSGTDSTEKGRVAWARVKGKTENDLMKLPFKKVYNFRPGFIKPIAGLKNTLSFYKYINWLFPVGRALYSKGFCTLEELAQAMINAAAKGYEKQILEGNDIIILGKK